VRPASAGGEQLVVLARFDDASGVREQDPLGGADGCSWRAMTSLVRQRLRVVAASVIAAARPPSRAVGWSRMTSTSMPMVAPCSTAAFLNPVSTQALEIVG
jgi:hypothetical protein